jgi:hypothetical protein
VVKWGRRRLDEPLTLRCEVVLTFRCTEKSLMPGFQEKLLAITYREPYRKPTQVDR